MQDEQTTDIAVSGGNQTPEGPFELKMEIRHDLEFTVDSTEVHGAEVQLTGTGRTRTLRVEGKVVTYARLVKGDAGDKVAVKASLCESGDHVHIQIFCPPTWRAEGQIDLKQPAPRIPMSAMVQAMVQLGLIQPGTLVLVFGRGGSGSPFGGSDEHGTGRDDQAPE